MTITKSIWLVCPPETSFRLFCDEMSAWWPGGFGGKDSRPMLEPRVGGRFFERRPDGSEYEIGRVTAYQPPTLVAFTFRAPSWEAVTQVEIRFSTERGGTRLNLEHSGWEQDAKIREARKNYETGWDGVLGHFETACGSAA